MLQIHKLKKQCVFGGHDEGKGTAQHCWSLGQAAQEAPPFLENVKSQQDQTLTDLI